MKTSESFPTLNKTVFFSALVCLLVVSLPLIYFPEWSSQQLSLLNDSIHDHLGFVYQWLVIVVLVVAVWISVTKAGKIRLGTSSPRFDTYSWASMIFCAGVATGILYWGFVEWAYYVNTPPFGLDPHSSQAFEWAATYGMFHWGPAGWAFYVLPALAIGHAYYNIGYKSMRLSTACSGILGSYTDKLPGKIIDVIFMIGLLGASGTSLGLGTPMVASAIDSFTGVGVGFEVKLGIILVCSLIFATSVYLGIEKGIKQLSVINTWLAFAFLGFILLVGPTVFILEMATNSVGLMTQDFIRMLTWTEAIDDSGFVKDWSIFYWSWWTAVGPFMGIFIARISEGRTFRQIVAGTILFGSAGCFLFYAILGNYAMFQEIQGLVISTDLVEINQAPMAISEIIGTLPFSTMTIIFFAAMSIIFMATSFDSTSYILATVTTKKLEQDIEPKRWLRLFWAVLLILLPIGLMLIGSLESLKTTVLISALPLVVVYIFMILSLIRWIKNYKP